MTKPVSHVFSFDEEMLCKWLCHLSKALFDEYGLILCQQQRQNNMCKPSIGSLGVKSDLDIST